MKLLFKALIGAVFVFSASVSQALVIYESATLGTTGAPGGTELSDQFLGSRFTLTDTYDVTAIGGHLSSTGGDVWGAIVEMSGLLPTFSRSEIESEALAFATFTAFPSQDLLSPVNVQLVPGDYALIFGGGGFFSTTGSGAMPEVNTDTMEGAGSYFFLSQSGDNNWADGGISNARFVVEGDLASVPEPSTLALLSIGFLGIGASRKLKKQ